MGINKSPERLKMFVSSYNTYINTYRTETNKHQNKEGSFSLKKGKTVLTDLPAKYEEVRLPFNYISHLKVLRNQQKLQEQTQQSQKTKFAKVTTLKNAQVAYSENSTMFALLKKPKVPLGRIHSSLPSNAGIKQNALNTYIANDNYYKVTA